MVEAGFHALHADGFSVVLETTADNELIWRHWGARVDPAELPPFDATLTRTTFSLDHMVPMSILPTTGFGWFGPEGLRCHRAGKHAGQRLTTRCLANTRAGLQALLADDQCGVEVTVGLAIQSGCLCATTRLRNAGTTPLCVDWLASAVFPLPAQADALVSFSGRHNGEMVEHCEPMPAQGWSRTTRQGLTGHGGPPGWFILGATADWHSGDVWAAQLAWSGDSRLLIERDGSRGWIALLGPGFGPGEIVLAPGEVLSAPDVLACFSTHGRNGAIQAFHGAIRARRPSPSLRPRPVHFNSWESAYFDHDEARTIALAGHAAALGVERFVLDDGWFRGRDSDRAGLGDWVADPVRYPRGLGPVADRVAELGMGFGLWAEPEMVNPDSELYRQHPGWILGAAEVGDPLTARHQLVLDMAREDVRDYLFMALSALLRDLPIVYLKWDHNRALAPVSGADGRPSTTKQLLGTWALWDRLRAAFPALEIEACAAGGGRIDAGFASRAERFWTSDNIDAVSRSAIQRSFLHFMPPEMMGAHVGASPSHATGRTQSMDFRAMVALPGHFGVELDPDRLSSGDRTRLAYWVNRFKSLRSRLHHGSTWLGEGQDGLLWQAHGESRHFLLLVTRTKPARYGREAPLVLPMVADLPRLVVRLLDRAGPPGGTPAVFAGEEAGEWRVAGRWLAAHGLPIPDLGGEGAALFELNALNEQ